jgi:hypothetical protein
VVFSGYSSFLLIKIDRHDITGILLKVALNTITLPPLLSGWFLLNTKNEFTFSKLFVKELYKEDISIV